MSDTNKGKIEIKTTGQLRSFLAELMVDVKRGFLDTDRASRITKLAGQINENFYAEIKVAKVRAEAGDELTKLGSLLVGE